MGFNRILFGASLLSFFGLSNNVLSQDLERSQNLNLSHNKYKLGLEMGVITNKDTKGITSSIYFSNPIFQIGGIIEGNTKQGIRFLEDQMDLLKFGVAAEYFPTKYDIVRPYIGCELKYENENLFVPRKNRNYKKNGAGLEIKIGTELNSFKYYPVRLFLELGYNISVNKKSKGYLLDHEIERDKFIIVTGIKF